MKQTSSDIANNPQKLLHRAADEFEKSRKAARGSITHTMTGWLAAQYACATERKIGSASPDHWDILNTCIINWTRLRRSDQAADRIEIARDQVEINRSNSAAQKEQEIRAIMKNPDLRQKYEPEPGGLTPEVLEKIERELKLL